MEICKAPTPRLKVNDDPSAAWAFNPGFSVCGVRVSDWKRHPHTMKNSCIVLMGGRKVLYELIIRFYSC